MKRQLKLIPHNKAGRPAIHDKGIRHIQRPKFFKPTSFHLTIKVRANKADIQNKKILKALHHAIRRARMKGLKVIHYTLEYNHIHLLVEAGSHFIMHSGMQALGISFSKAVNRLRKVQGTVYKHRYHYRQLKGPRDLKNVLHYIFRNGIKHKRTLTILNPYNSAVAESLLPRLYPSLASSLWADVSRNQWLRCLKEDLHHVLCPGSVYFRGLRFV